jgi:hypothetical protein
MNFLNTIVLGVGLGLGVAGWVALARARPTPARVKPRRRIARPAVNLVGQSRRFQPALRAEESRQRPKEGRN